MVALKKPLLIRDTYIYLHGLDDSIWDAEGEWPPHFYIFSLTPPLHIFLCWPPALTYFYFSTPCIIFQDPLPLSCKLEASGKQGQLLSLVTLADTRNSCTQVHALGSSIMISVISHEVCMTKSIKAIFNYKYTTGSWLAIWQFFSTHLVTGLFSFSCFVLWIIYLRMLTLSIVFLVLAMVMCGVCSVPFLRFRWLEVMWFTGYRGKKN